MSRRIRLAPLLKRIAPMVLLLFASIVPFTLTHANAVAQERSALIVDDAKTANPDLVPVEVADPNGFGVTGHTLMAPPGTTISVVGAKLGGPRFMTFDSAGNLLVAAQGDGTGYRYPYTDGNLGEPEALITGLNQPASVALFTAGKTEYLYVGEVQQISRYRYDPAGPVGSQEVVIPNLPTGGHHTRTVAFGPDGMLYLAVGSSCNICQEKDDIRATVSRANPDGSDLKIIATGLRNPVGLAFQPGTDHLWATVNERDNQGNEIPPDLVTIIHEGANYGWPNCLPPDAKPQQSGADCANITPPTIGIQAHSAPLGLAFLTGNGVPADLDGDLVVAQHGSWNRQPPAAPKLLLIQFKDGAPVAARDLVTGWQDANGNRWGRPAGVVVAPDGSLIVSDDASGLLLRISFGS
ncbi:MAG TPA: PQQ-dependent sugar dehydrogenase [Thermomicrobiales bacterium]|nr:PQQ-dependent sugar dehydrogenase [Thermomicrobiales bacterium]